MKIYIFLFALLLTGTCSSAQVGFGPELGVGLSTMRFAPQVGFTSASGSTIFSGKVGGIADFKFNRHVYFQTGLFFSRKGQTREFSFYSADTLNESVQQTLNINYLDVPVNVIFKTATQGKGRVMVGMGITPSFIVGGRNKIHATGVYNDTPFVVNTFEQIANGKPVASFDIGFNLIAGYELPTGLFFRVYYTTGIKDIGLDSEIDKNRMWGISAGYIFGKGRNINKEAEDLIDKTKD